MNRLSILTLAIAATCCLASNFYFELSNDPNYPASVSVSNVRYSLTTSKNIDVSATVTIHEEINDGTSVSFFSIFFCVCLCGMFSHVAILKVFIQ